MAQVPYSPVPDVQPEDRVAYPPQLQLHVNSDMFGGQVASAVERLGSTVDKVGDELWQRAVAMQEIRNQSELDNLNSQFLNETAPIHARFSALQGKDAYDGLQQYQTDLNGVRERLQTQASNPMVARLFDTSTRNQIARDFFNGAGHAGQQLKVYQDDAASGHVDAIRHSAGLSPMDDEGFQKKVDDTVAAVKDQAAIRGLDPDDAVGKAVSKLWGERLVAMGRTQPFKATTLLKENTDKIRSDDYDRTDKALQFQRNTTGARNISSGLLNGRFTTLGEAQVPIELAKKAIGGFESGDRYEITGPVTHLGRPLGRYQVMTAELPSQLKEAGLPPMTPEQFLKDHDAQDKLFETVFGNLMSKYGSFNEAASRWFTGRSVDDARAKGVKDVFGTNVNSYLANTNAILAKNIPQAQLIAAGNKVATSLSDDPLLPSYTEQHLTADSNRVRNQEKSLALQDQNTIASAISGEFSNGKIPNSFDDLRAIPQVQQVIESGRMTPKQMLEIPGQLNRYRSALQVRTQKDVKNRLEGMADEEPLEFQAIDDFTKFPLSQGDIGHFQKLQREKRASAAGDPNLAKAYAAIRPQLPDDFDSAPKRDTRLQFKGALREAVLDRMQEKGRKLNNDEYVEVGKQLLKQTVVGPGWIQTLTGGRYGTPQMSGPWWEGASKIPDGAKEAIKQDWEDQGLGVPSEEQMRDIYLRERFHKDFGKTKE